MITVATPDLVQALRAGLDKQKDEWDNSKLHASDLGATIPGEGCLRQVWLRVRGAERRPLTLGEGMMFDAAHRLHERAGQLLKAGLGDGWELAGVEVPVKGLPEGLTGRLDLLLYHRPTERLEVWDVKTVRGRAFNYLEDAKPGNVIQVRSYMMGANVDAAGGGILYLDREGSNAAITFSVARNDDAVKTAALTLREAAEAHAAPDILEPVLERKENKGPDSIYLKEPWPCSYCRYRDVSCPGALPAGLRELGIVAKIKDNGELIPQTDNEEALAMVERMLWAPAEV